MVCMQTLPGILSCPQAPRPPVWPEASMGALSQWEVWQNWLRGQECHCPLSQSYIGGREAVPPPPLNTVALRNGPAKGRCCVCSSTFVWVLLFSVWDRICHWSKHRINELQGSLHLCHQCWGYKHVPQHGLFHGCWRSEFMSSSLTRVSLLTELSPQHLEKLFTTGLKYITNTPL